MKPEQVLRANQRHGTPLLSTATWYCWLLTGFCLYSVNLQGNVVPFLQAEFALSDRAVSLHSSAIAVGIIRSQKTEVRFQARHAPTSEF